MKGVLDNKEVQTEGECIDIAWCSSGLPCLTSLAGVISFEMYKI